MRPARENEPAVERKGTPRNQPELYARARAFPKGTSNGRRAEGRRSGHRAWQPGLEVAHSGLADGPGDVATRTGGWLPHVTVARSHQLRAPVPARCPAEPDGPLT